MKKSRLFISAKPGDVIRIGSTFLRVIEVAGKVRFCIEADIRLPVDFAPKKEAICG